MPIGAPEIGGELDWTVSVSSLTLDGMRIVGGVEFVIRPTDEQQIAFMQRVADAVASDPDLQVYISRKRPMFEALTPTGADPGE